MLIIDESANQKLAEMIQLALNEDCMDALLPRLESLKQRAEGDNTNCTLYHDSADYSLMFQIFDRASEDHDWVFRSNGGLIYDGPAQRKDNFSINLEPNPGVHRWSIHT